MLSGGGCFRQEAAQLGRDRHACADIDAADAAHGGSGVALDAVCFVRPGEQRAAEPPSHSCRCGRAARAAERPVNPAPTTATAARWSPSSGAQAGAAPAVLAHRLAGQVLVSCVMDSSMDALLQPVRHERHRYD